MGGNGTCTPQLRDILWGLQKFNQGLSADKHYLTIVTRDSFHGTGMLWTLPKLSSFEFLFPAHATGFPQIAILWSNRGLLVTFLSAFSENKSFCCLASFSPSFSPSSLNPTHVLGKTQRSLTLPGVRPVCMS